MQRVVSLLTYCLLTAIAAGTPARSVCQTTQQLRRVGDFYARSDKFSGIVVVVRNGSILSNESYGQASVELDVPITSETRFAIGSLTKQFTAASILLLQEQGLLRTTDALAQHYPTAPALWKDVTLRQLLQHTSGVPDGLNNFGTAAFAQSRYTPEEIIGSVAARPLLFAPGSRIEHDNMGYILLGLVVQMVSKQSYAGFLQQHFFNPLQMNDTVLASTGAVIQNLANGYAPESSGLPTADPVPFTPNFSAGGLYSTGKDLAKWLTALHGGRVLAPSSYAE